MKPDWTAAVLSTAIAAFISVVAVGVIIHRKKKSTALSHKN